MCIVTKAACKERCLLCQMFDPLTDQARSLLSPQFVSSTRSRTKNIRKNDRPTCHLERITIGRYARMCHVWSLHDARKQCKCWTTGLVDFCSNNSATVLRVGFHPPNSYLKLLGHEMLVFLGFRTNYLIDTIWFSSCSRRRGPQVLWMSEYNFPKIFSSPTCMHVRWFLSLHLVYEWPVCFTMGVRTLWSCTSSFSFCIFCTEYLLSIYEGPHMCSKRDVNTRRWQTKVTTLREGKCIRHAGSPRI